MDKEKFIERLQQRTNIVQRDVLDTPCAEWLGARCGLNGEYGQSWWDGRRQMAHRVFWQIYVGPIPLGPDGKELELDHLCFNPICVAPWHLRPATHKENRRNNRSRLQPCCPNGHEWTEENTCITLAGSRTCRTCRDGRVRTYAAANPEKMREAVRRYQAKRRAFKKLQEEKIF